jgi:HSP20 family protein
MRYRHLRERYAMLVADAAGARWWVAGEREVIVGSPAWRPNVDVCDAGDHLSVTAELAGVEPEDVDVVLYEDALVIAGERRLPPCDAPAVYLVVRIRRGPFRIEIPLSAAVAPEGVTARFEHGLLRVTLPARGA